MQMHYFYDPSGNFGDDLNPWLWPQLFPNLFDEQPDEIFVGIGTLINHRLPASPFKHIFGSGLGYGAAPKIDGSYAFHTVRGYETAKALALNPRCVITDPAVLIRAVPYPRAPKPLYPFGFMATGHSISNYDWEALCSDVNIHFISCHWEVERVLFEISQCETLITEAMHGAIVADALRIPWIPVNCYGYVLDFKWIDWLSTMNLPYRPSRITPVFSPQNGTSKRDLLKSQFKRSLKSLGIWTPNWSPPLPKASKPEICEQAREDLITITKNATFLSSDKITESHTSRYLDLVERFTINRNT